MHEVNVYIHYYTTGNFSYIWIIILCKHRCVCVCMHVCVVGRGGGGCREGRWWNRLHNAIVKNSDWRWVWLFFIIQLKNYLTIYSYRFPNQIANEVDFSYTNQFIQFMMWGKNHSNLKFIHVYMLLVASTPPPPQKNVKIHDGNQLHKWIVENVICKNTYTCISLLYLYVGTCTKLRIVMQVT